MSFTTAPILVRIPSGEFIMGCSDGATNERPVHSVWLDTFFLATLPVSRNQYALFLKDTGRQPPPFWHQTQFSGPDQPALGPNWHDAVAYCTWLASDSGTAYRLPSEAEREKAARGDLVQQAYPWGNELPPDHRGGRDAQIAAVGCHGPNNDSPNNDSPNDYNPNNYGLYDMASGVHEWCADFYSADYYRDSPPHNPTGPDQGVRRVARGGSWRHAVRFSRCAARSSLPPDRHFSDFGFRLAADL
jgi:formylglycine-generating enzyme